ncbi:MAG: SMI1/KNR4 family protein [Planctomycetota bacterium]|nr:MAG: SMI1/KNR4 family protein [Planctomycetota bacterium]REJ90510.1 MAG: SMI1/KNR4 family protein [Planctomycetota bacterium]REK24133.1 MAG: SMI1/KNR4 family protein [Planctomycetota bacterium]REK38290.1 MAG: SMI1/KNR4 family protein [Planctomycetota bacterium]
MAQEPNIDSLLCELTAVVTATPERSFFNPPATESQITVTESKIGTPLPASFKSFLRVFNGGFISVAGTTNDEIWDQDHAEWNSNSLFGTDKLLAEFDDLKTRFTADLGWKDPWKYVPFCHTDGQELLVFGPLDHTSNECPVLDAFHEVWPREWGKLYPDFVQLLAAYIAGNGTIKTIAEA